MKVNLTNESIFYTLQGEGLYAGHPSLFIRLSGCNLRCGWKNADGSKTLCDTPYSSFNPDKYIVDENQIFTEIDKYSKDVHIVITGGEPMMQKQISSVIDYASRKHKVTIETNGTLYWKNSAQFFSVSPKLSTSEHADGFESLQKSKRLNYLALAEIVRNHEFQFKFVYNSKEDLTEIDEIIQSLKRLTVIDINSHIWLMPQGVTESQFNSKSQEIWGICKERGWKYTDRLHIRTYGQKAGV